MSERGQEQRTKSTLYDDCNKCSQRYMLTKENTVGFIYSKQQECSHLCCICPNCQWTVRIYDRNAFAIAEDSGIDLVTEDDVAPHAVYEKWLVLKNIELPKTYVLTNRQERLIGHFAAVLEKIPADLMMDGFESEHERPYPEHL